MRTNYVLIDFENVQPASLAGLEAEHFRVLVFVGANQSRISLEIAAALQPLGERAQYFRIAGNGPNAVDFHIAFQIGRIAAQEPTAYFHIISKDTGFDPLVQYLNARKIRASRSSNTADIPLLKAASARNVAEKAAIAVANLNQRGAAKPRTLKTLHSTISALFHKQLPQEEIDAVLRHLQAEGIIAVQDDKLSYALPSEG